MVVGDGAELDVGPPLVVLQAQGESRVFCQRGDGEWDCARTVGLCRDCGTVQGVGMHVGIGCLDGDCVGVLSGN